MKYLLLLFLTSNVQAQDIAPRR